MSAMPKSCPAHTAKLEAALQYAILNLPVLPVHNVLAGKCSCGKGNCATPGKHPRTPNGVKDATTAESTIREWWSRWPNANIALVTHGLAVIDGDPRNGYERKLLPADMPQTWHAISGSGGDHFFFRMREGASYPSKLEGCGPGIDIKSGSGSYIIVAPSSHKSGGCYRWAEGMAPWDSLPIVEAPRWMEVKPKNGPENGANSTSAVLPTRQLLQRVRSALAAIPADDLHPWLEMLYACKTMGEQGKAAMLEYSMRSTKFDAAEFERKWAGCAPNATGVNAIFAEAKRHGWVDERFVDLKNPLAIASSLVDGKYTHHSGVSILRWFQKQWYRWTGAAYEVVDPDEIRQDIYDVVSHGVNAAGNPVRPNKRAVDDVLDALRAVCLLRVKHAPAWVDGAPPYPLEEMSPMANGILHWTTRTLIAPTPALFAVHAMPYDFDANAPLPAEWSRFLASTFGADQEAIETLQEFFGLALTLTTRYQKGLMIVGPKRSGKGTIGRVLTALVGAANTVAPTLLGLGGAFGLQPLIGKSLAIISDARLGTGADQHAIAEALLRVIGEDHVSIPRKHTTDYTARLPVRFLILTNEVPALTDTSGALPSRFVTLRLVRSFYGSEDIGLTDRLLMELPSIFNWALDGLDRLTARGHFIQPESGRAMFDQLDELASPVMAFIRECCIVESGASIECGALFSEWLRWGERSNRSYGGTAQTFGRNLHAAVPGLRTTQLRRRGGRVKQFVGIRFRRASDVE